MMGVNTLCGGKAWASTLKMVKAQRGCVGAKGSSVVLGGAAVCRRDGKRGCRLCLSSSTDDDNVMLNVS